MKVGWLFLLFVVLLSSVSSIVDDDEEDIALLRKILHRKPSKPQYRKDSVDEKSLETRAVFQESQRQRIRSADRDGKSDIILARHDETITEYSSIIALDEDFYHQAYGIIAGCTPSNVSNRRIRDMFASEEECRELVDATEHAMQNLFHRGGTTSIAPCHKQSQERLGVKGALLFEYLIHKTKLQIMREYNLSKLYTSGSLLTRLVADPPLDKWDMDPNHIYWNAHVDKANIPTYDYSALLYLNTHGSNFSGGEFAFVDDDFDRVVQPRSGRLVTFTSGPENLHRVRRVTRGRRYVLAMWFTCSEVHKYQDEEPKSPPGVEKQVLELRRINQDLIKANDLMLRASEKLRLENEQLRTIGKLCLANGGLDGALATDGRKGNAAEGHEDMLRRMALDRRLAAEREFAKNRLAAAKHLSNQQQMHSSSTSVKGHGEGSDRQNKHDSGLCRDVDSCNRLADERARDGDDEARNGDDSPDFTSFGRQL